MMIAQLATDVIALDTNSWINSYLSNTDATEINGNIHVSLPWGQAMMEENPIVIALPVI